MSEVNGDNDANPYSVFGPSSTMTYFTFFVGVISSSVQNTMYFRSLNAYLEGSDDLILVTIKTIHTGSPQ